MASPKYYRDTKLDKIFDEIRPEIKALIASQSFGQPYPVVQHTSPSFRQSQQQLLELIENCRQQIEFYTHLKSIYQERLSQVLESPVCLPYNTSFKKHQIK